MNRVTDIYITEVLSEVRYKNCHREIADELEEHMEILHSEFAAEGKSEKDAWDMVVHAMGEPHQLGREFNSVHRAPVDWYTWIPILGLIGINLLMGVQYLENGIFRADRMRNILCLALIGILVIWGMGAYFRYVKEFDINWMGIYTALVVGDSLLTIYTGFVRGDGSYSYKYLLPPLYMLLLFKIADGYSGLPSYKKAGFGILLFLTVFLLALGPKLNLLLYLWAAAYVFFTSKKQIRAVVGTAVLSAGAIIAAYFTFIIVTGKEYEIQRALSILTMRQEHHVVLQQQLSYSLFRQRILESKVYQQLYSNTGEFLPTSIFHYSTAVFLVLMLTCLGFYISIHRQLDDIRKSWKQKYFLSAYLYMAARFMYCLLMNMTAVPVIGITMPLTLGNPCAFICDCMLVGMLINLKYEPRYRRSLVTEGEIGI